MRMFELLPRPLGNIFRKLTHLACNSSKRQSIEWGLGPSVTYEKSSSFFTRKET